MNDKRKRTAAITATLAVCLATGLAIFAPNYGVLAVFVFLAGLAMAYLIMRN